MPDYIIAELRHDSKVGYSSNGFHAKHDQVKEHTDGLNDLLGRHGVNYVASHFDCEDHHVACRIDQAPEHIDEPVSSEFAHAGFVQIACKRKKDHGPLVEALNGHVSVWTAYRAPDLRPAASPSIPIYGAGGSRNFEPAQGYLYSAPVGVGAMAAWGKAGGRGKGVKICDIEGNWNFKHEDLPARIKLVGGQVFPDPFWRNHGTAVLGTLVAKRNKIGVHGICDQSSAFAQSIVPVGGSLNITQNFPTALENAVKVLDPGDIVLIEVEGFLDDNETGVAIQNWPDCQSAIIKAVNAGLIVVQPSGNGGIDLDGALTNDGAKKDIGAITVGAGVPPSNFFDFGGLSIIGKSAAVKYTRIGTPRARAFWSCYGSILNLQSWGWNVASSGFGDAEAGTGENKWYTLRFGGTSSASAIVAGAAACIQGRARELRGTPLTPAQVRTLLVTTGTPQEDDPNQPLSQRIGPQPDLEKAFEQLELIK